MRINGSFDGPNRRFLCNSGVVQIDIQALYSDWKDWVRSGAGAGFLPFMRVIGGEATSGGNFAGRVFFFSNGFQIRPQSANHELQLIGNVFTENGGPLLVPVPGFTITAAVERSSLADGIATGGGATSPAAIAQAVRSALAADLARLEELHKLRGLTNVAVEAEPPTEGQPGYQRTADNTIQQTITAQGNKRTIQRQ